MKLTEKQGLFAVEYILNGNDATKAYEKVYDCKKSNKNTIYSESCKVLHNPKVAQRVNELRMAQYTSHVITIEERKILLSAFSHMGDIKAIDLLNKMENVYAIDNTDNDKPLRVQIERISKS